MTSKHYRWQRRWRVDLVERTATHESGFVVAFAPGRAGEALPVNAEAIAAALAPKHGPHNVPAMLARLEREACQAFAEQSGE